MLMEFEVPLPTASFTLPVQINDLFPYPALHGNTGAQRHQSHGTPNYGVNYKTHHLHA